MAHLLVTNDFPPKLGGIQSYLWELWRRLPADRALVATASHAGHAEFDATQSLAIRRFPQRVLLPTPALVRRIQALVADQGGGLVVLDPALPLGLIGPRLDRPYGVIVHGAEITAPARLPGTRALLRSVLRGAALVIAAGSYPAAEAKRVAGRQLPLAEIPPGADLARFRPLAPADRLRARAEFGLPAEGPLVLGLSRLVPRKGMDVLVAAAARLGTRPDLTVAIAGPGRDRSRLERLARAAGAPVRFLGAVPDERLPRLFGAADVFCMLCRSRWGGLEQEGFGVVFLEAAACGVPQVAGSSGGSAEAVADGETGFVVEHPRDVDEAVAALARLIDDQELRHKQGEAARRRAEEHFSYDGLAADLDRALLPFA